MFYFVFYCASSSYILNAFIRRKLSRWTCYAPKVLRNRLLALDRKRLCVTDLKYQNMWCKTNLVSHDLSLFVKSSNSFVAVSSYASPNLYFPTRVLLLLLFLGCFLPASSSALRKHVKNSWRTPCAGATPVPMMSTLMTGDLNFEELSRSSSVLKRIVITLKNDYVSSK